MSNIDTLNVKNATAAPAPQPEIKVSTQPPAPAPQVEVTEVGTAEGEFQGGVTGYVEYYSASAVQYAKKFEEVVDTIWKNPDSINFNGIEKYETLRPMQVNMQQVATGGVQATPALMAIHKSLAETLFSDVFVNLTYDRQQLLNSPTRLLLSRAYTIVEALSVSATTLALARQWSNNKTRIVADNETINAADLAEAVKVTTSLVRVHSSTDIENAKKRAGIEETAEVKENSLYQVLAARLFDLSDACTKLHKYLDSEFELGINHNPKVMQTHMSVLGQIEAARRLIRNAIANSSTEHESLCTSMQSVMFTPNAERVDTPSYRVHYESGTDTIHLTVYVPVDQALVEEVDNLTAQAQSLLKGMSQVQQHAVNDLLMQAVIAGRKSAEGTAQQKAIAQYGILPQTAAQAELAKVATNGWNRAREHAMSGASILGVYPGNADTGMSSFVTHDASKSITGFDISHTAARVDSDGGFSHPADDLAKG